MQYVSLSRFRCTQQELPLGHGARLTVQTEGCQAVDGFFQLSSPQRLHLRHKKTQTKVCAVSLVWRMRLELTRIIHTPLKRTRLPIPPSPQVA